MSWWRVSLLGLWLPCSAVAQAPVSLHVSFDTYAAGIMVAKVDAGFNLAPTTYDLGLAYRTTGMAGLLFSGNQVSHVDGSWRGRQVSPARFVGQGHWRGADRVAEIDYRQGYPEVRRLAPPNETEREPVPDALRAGTIDTLSALVTLIRTVADTGRCETSARTYDGRRLVAVEARTVGDETLEPTARSVFAGKALRCDFAGKLVAGFKFDDDRTRDARPMRGSAWLAPVAAGGPAVPVRMTFETKWFGDATMYLTGSGAGADGKAAGRK